VKGELAFNDAPMTGRRQASKDARRRAIIALAERRFLQDGYAATSMSAIAAELGGSKGTLWTYFPSKDALFTAVTETIIERFTAALDEALLRGGGTGTTLDRFGRVFLERVTSASSVALMRLLISSAERFPQCGALFHEQAWTRVTTRLSRFIGDEIEAGHLAACDPALASQQFLALCHLRPYHLLTSAGPALSDEVIDQDVRAAVCCFLRAYGSSRPDGS
jgi:TetR/AcrR family transcriptional repressor of mexJK operon